MQFFKSSKDPVNPLPFRVYYLVVVGLAVCGLVASLYLSISHYRVYTDIGYRSFCALTRAINCDTVSQSPYAIFLDVPVPVWGIWGYLLLLLLLLVVHGRQTAKTRIWAIAFLISMAFSLYSCVLAYISSYYIQSYCLVCIATYAVNFLLAYFTWLIRKRFDSRPLIAALKGDFQYITQKRRQILVLGGVFLAVFVSLIALFPDYWNLRLGHHSSQLLNGLTKDGHPYIGADSPEIIITEYTDYLCFQCRKMHFYLRELIQRHPDKIRLVHRHFPMDHKFNPIVKKPFHEGSGMMALVAIYLEKLGKFWQANDYFFSIAGQTQTIDLHQMAGKLNLNLKELTAALNDGPTRRQLSSDILQGLKLGVTGTPTYVINGKIYHATIPPPDSEKGFGMMES